MRTDPRSIPARCHPRGFTLIELLVVIAVIAILTTLALVSARAVRGAARTAGTTGLLNTLSQAIAAFEKDFAFEPPLISRVDLSNANPNAPAEGGVITPELEAQRSGNAGDAVLAYRRIRYNSEFSLPAYLMGMGGLNGRATQQGTGASTATGFPPNTASIGTDKPDFKAQASHDGVPGPGLRNPGPLRTWKKAGTVPGTFVHAPDLTGRVYGPYLDAAQLSNNMELVEVNRADGKRRLNTIHPVSDVYMYRFIEASGEPVKYYRGWPTRDPNSTNPEGPSIARVPVELRDEAAIRTEATLTNTSRAALPSDSRLMSASYMLLAPNLSIREEYLGAVSAQTPFGTQADATFEQAMPFLNVSDPQFDASKLSDDSGDVGRRLLEFAARAVRIGPQ